MERRTPFQEMKRDPVSGMLRNDLLGINKALRALPNENRALNPVEQAIDKLNRDLLVNEAAVKEWLKTKSWAKGKFFAGVYLQHEYHKHKHAESINENNQVFMGIENLNDFGKFRDSKWEKIELPI